MGLLIPLLVLAIMYHVVKGEDNTTTENGNDLEERTVEKFRAVFNSPALRGVLLPIATGTTECDVVCITTRGVFVAECKHRRDNVAGSVHADTWTVLSPRQTYLMENPLKQNYYHVQAMKSYLESRGLNVPVHSVVVLIGKGTVSLTGENEISTKIIRSFEEIGSLLSYPETVPQDIAEQCFKAIAEREATNEELAAHKARIQAKYGNG